MKTEERRSLKDAGLVAAVCAFCGLLLLTASFLITPAIERQRNMDEARAFQPADGSTLGERHEISEVSGVTAVYPVLASSGTRNGWFSVLSGTGYGGNLILGVWYENDGTVKDVRVIRHGEAAGVGRTIGRAAYMKKFVGRGGSVPLPSLRSQLKGDDADGVTGATVTFSGLAKAIQAGSTYVRSLKAGS